MNNKPSGFGGLFSLWGQDASGGSLIGHRKSGGRTRIVAGVAQRLLEVSVPVWHLITRGQLSDISKATGQRAKRL